MGNDSGDDLRLPAVVRLALSRQHDPMAAYMQHRGRHEPVNALMDALHDVFTALECKQITAVISGRNDGEHGPGTGAEVLAKILDDCERAHRTTLHPSWSPTAFQHDD